MTGRPVRRRFSVSRIRRETFAGHVDYHRSLQSTNTRAMELAAQPHLPVPALVLTELQTAGRGRGANAWWSSSGALTFSLILDLHSDTVQPESWPRFALAAAVGICDALESMTPNTRFGIRWPNDVCMEQRKICGILPELHLNRTPRLVLGVGINVNNSVRNAPEELQIIATSLLDLTARRTQLTEALVCVLQSLEKRFDQLAHADSALPQAWISRCMLRGRRVRLRMDSDEIAGICTGIDATGALELQTSRGTQRFYGGTIVHDVPGYQGVAED